MRPSEALSPAAFRRYLAGRDLRFACAESCTGGLLARQMTAAAGASDLFWGGAVVYANEAKERLLGVEPALIQAEGAVSGAVAEALVRGLLRLSGCELGVSITGVAGPGGGTPEKPVGTVWFGLGVRQEAGLHRVAVRHRFDGGRGAVQTQAAAWARTLAARWHEGGMTLDSLQRLADNAGKPFVEAYSVFPPIPANL